MGLRPLCLEGNSNAAAAMAPALTEPISQQAKLSSPANAASPRPGNTVNNNNGDQFTCAKPVQGINCEDAFLLAFGTDTSTNGPTDGPSDSTHMDKTDVNCSTSSDQSSQPLQAAFSSSPDLQSIQLHCPSDTSPTTSSSATLNNNINSNSTMGLQKDYLKDNAEMEQMLGDLASGSDIDLMQVFKSFESAQTGDNLCDLAGGLALFNDVDVMNMGLDDVSTPHKETEVDHQELRDEIVKRQAQMVRKCDFLVRRLRKVQARYMGQHVNEEVNGLFEYTQQLLKRKEREQKTISTMTPINQAQKDKNKPLSALSMKALIKRIETVANSQQTTVHSPTKLSNNNRVGVVDNGLPKVTAVVSALSIIPTFDEEGNQQVAHMSGLLHTELCAVAAAVDSDATASSSGGESADEMVSYSNTSQKSMTM